MKELYKKTYSHLHASDETYLEVMNMYQKRRNKRSPVRVLLIAAVAVLVIRCRKMSKVKDDLRDEIDKAEKSSPDGI